MSKRDIQNSTATIGALHFNLPERRLNPSRVGYCFCCSHRLEKVYIEAICAEDNKPRKMHVICWESNQDDNPGLYRRLETLKERNREYTQKQRAKFPQD